MVEGLAAIERMNASVVQLQSMPCSDDLARSAEECDVFIGYLLKSFRRSIVESDMQQFDPYLLAVNICQKPERLRSQRVVAF